MTKVTITASTEYDILIGRGLLDRIGEQTAELIRGRQAVVVSDETTYRLFFERVCDSLTLSGFSVHSFVIAPGETSKNAQNYIALLEYAVSSGICRDDVFIALGGGVVGDLTGFAASTCMRGVAYIQVPTTILSAVDSSVGGKTAIDLAAGKNLAGTFCQPKLVLCDTDTMDTLTEEVFADGCGEILKYAVLGDRDMVDRVRGLRSDFSLLKRVRGEENYTFTHSISSTEPSKISESEYKLNLELIISDCVRMKSHYVSADEYDKGIRTYLNLGHTIGHAIELLSGYTVSHGQSVATGIAYAAVMAERLLVCDTDAKDEIIRAVAAAGYAVTAPYSAGELAHAALADKKRSGDKITLVLPKRPGECELRRVDTSSLEALLENRKGDM